MTKALLAKNKLGFVDGSIPEPSDPNSPLFFLIGNKEDIIKKE